MTDVSDNLADEKEIKNQKQAVLIVSAFAAFLVPFLSSAINLALPSIGQDIHVNAISLSWVVSSSRWQQLSFSSLLESLVILSEGRRYFLSE